MYKDGDVCPICGSGRIKAIKNKEDFEYKGHILTFDLTTYSCDICHESFFNNQEMKANQKIIKDFHRRVDGLLTSDEIKKIRQNYGLSQREFARILGIGEKSFTKYELGLVSQSRAMDNLLRIIDEIPEALSLLKQHKTVMEDSRKRVVGNIIDFENYKLERKKPYYQVEEKSSAESPNNEYNIA